jgi:hypothetical protein
METNEGMIYRANGKTLISGTKENMTEPLKNKVGCKLNVNYTMQDNMSFCSKLGLI